MYAMLVAAGLNTLAVLKIVEPFALIFIGMACAAAHRIAFVGTLAAAFVVFPFAFILSDIAVQLVVHIADAVFLSVFKLALVIIVASAARWTWRFEITLAVRLSLFVEFAVVDATVGKFDSVGRIFVKWSHTNFLRLT